MKIIYKAPKEKPKIIDIENSLKALQEAVGGYIETVSIASDAVIICNEEGLLKNMPLNLKLLGVPFFGPVLIVGVDGDEFTDLYEPEVMAELLFGDGVVE